MGSLDPSTTAGAITDGGILFVLAIIGATTLRKHLRAGVPVPVLIATDPTAEDLSIRHLSHDDPLLARVTTILKVGEIECESREHEQAIITTIAKTNWVRKDYEDNWVSRAADKPDYGECTYDELNKVLDLNHLEKKMSP